MSNKRFDDIVKRLKNKDITAAEAKKLFAAIKQEPQIETPVAASTVQQQEASTKSQAATENSAAEIAVIGVSGQFPGARNVEQFWDNLINGRDGITELPQEYLDQQRFYSPEKTPGKTYCKWGGVLEDRHCFDPLFFSLSPREAESMNPHQRLVLQEGWRALEDAGYNPLDLADSSTGTFIGAEPTGYFHETFVGASDAIIASRLAYYLDLKGPSLVVNTGCSSSAVALHLACESLRNGETTMALAGGVFATMGQLGLINLAQIEMLSPTGRCHTFDDKGDGTVLSEGIGMVVLKRLDDAIADGDPIYAVVQGSGMNQDGSSNGITAPSGLAQEKLIKSVYQRFAIDPETISYIEAHGTGTQLGDPVEANALMRAFKGFTQKTQFCSMGSVKAQIGHTSASAGVIGFIKVLLSMKHRQLPGLFQFDTMNSRIDLSTSPFFVHADAREWSSTADEPLTAGLNSFGHSGTNVHIVLKEYIPETAQTQRALSVAEKSQTEQGMALAKAFPLSAKNRARLQDYAENLLQWLQVQESPVGLHELAYTLQTAREPMTERVAFIADSLPALKKAVEQFIHDPRSGVLFNETGVVSVAAPQENTAAYWLEQGNAEALLATWLQQQPLDWATLNQQVYGTTQPGRLHTPVYPFARDRYWVAEADPQVIVEETGTVLHPLLHANVSTLERQCFTARFTGNEFFLDQHVVADQKILPAVAYLEMVRVAVSESIRLQPNERIQIDHIVLARPITVQSEPLQVYLSLVRESDARIRYKVFSGNDESCLHSQGLVSVVAQTVPQPLAIEPLKQRLSAAVLSPEECYSAYHTMGFDHGPVYQGLLTLFAGHNEVLAQVCLPEDAAVFGGEYALHPCLMDAALQAAIGLSIASFDQYSPDAKTPSLPFSLDSVSILAPCQETMWVWIRYAATEKKNSKIQKLDIDIADTEGNVCVAIRGFSSRILEGELGAETAPQETPSQLAPVSAVTPTIHEEHHKQINEELHKQASTQRHEISHQEHQQESRQEGRHEDKAIELLIQAPVWQQAPLRELPDVVFDHRQVLLVGLNKVSGIALEVQLDKALQQGAVGNAVGSIRCQRLEELQVLSHDGLVSGFEQATLALFDEVQALIHSLAQSHETKGRKLLQLVVGDQPNSLWFAAFTGLLRTLTQEHPTITTQLIEVESNVTAEELVTRIIDDSREAADSLSRCDHVRYANLPGQPAQRQTRAWESISPLLNDSPVSQPWKSQGVYLITGGLGGLGMAFAKEIAGSTESPVLILCGRSTFRADRQSDIDVLKALGASVEYHPVDIASAVAVEQQTATAAQRFGREKLDLGLGIFRIDEAGRVHLHAVHVKETGAGRFGHANAVAGARASAPTARVFASFIG